MSEENQKEINELTITILLSIVNKLEHFTQNIRTLCMQDNNHIQFPNFHDLNNICSHIEKLKLLMDIKNPSEEDKTFLTEEDIQPLVSRLYHLDLDVEEFKKKLDRMEDEQS